ncbi:hypothetical protein ACWCXX_38180 [Streptomyces sp. NPDC001732]
MLAHAIVDAARERGLALPVVADVTEEPGRGASGTVDGQRASIGRIDPADAVPSWAAAVDNRALLDGAAVAWLTIAGHVVGAVLLRDPIRSDAPRRDCHVGEWRGRIFELIMVEGDRPWGARRRRTSGSTFLNGLILPFVG